MSEEIKRINRVIKITNEVSPTLCLAKWYHVTMYMHLGETHSCYHPAPHTIPENELADNPSVLHNTLHKKKERALMLVGEKPSGCQYCWNVESLSDSHISDRMIKTGSLYRNEMLDEIKQRPWDSNFNPEYIEISFSNECNFKCGYCHPKHSTSYYSEIKQYGPYKNVLNHANDIDNFKIYEEDTNPYIKAWWAWWPEMSKTLNILRITGGEPLLHRTTWKLLDELKRDPKPKLELNFNSNLGASSRIIERFSNSIKELLDQKMIKDSKVFSSMETWGKRAEYIRTGLKLDLWEKNFHTFVTTTQRPISIMCTFNILTVTSFIDFLKKMLEWRIKYNDVIDFTDGKSLNYRKIRFDTPYLKEPIQFDMHILPKEEFLPYFDKILQFIDDNRDDADITKFSDLEYERFRRVRDYYATVQYDQARIIEGQRDFYNWFSQYDQRRGLNFLETFPEMKNFWKLCEHINNQKQ